MEKSRPVRLSRHSTGCTGLLTLARPSWAAVAAGPEVPTWATVR